MSNFLINTLLSHYPDPEDLINNLCWPSSSRPEIEEIEALTILIKELSNKSQEERFICKVQSVIWDQCMSLLKMISSADDGGKDLLSSVCGLFAVCVSTCQTDDVSEQVSHGLLQVLMTRDDANNETGRLDVDVAIEVTAVLLSSISYDRDIIFRTLSCTLCCVKDLSDSIVSKIIVRIWFTILKSCHKEAESEVLHQIWEDLLSWHQRDQTESVSARVLLCLTALSDHLYSWETSQNRPDPRRSQRFFRAIQAGLTHKDSVTRKRALYLLTRCVALAEIKKEDVFTSVEPHTDEILFRWMPEQQHLLREFWEDFALVLETLEENQIHVIRPVLKRIDVLVETTATDIQGGLFSPSWLLCVYQRMFHSENKAVMKEGVNHLLELKALHHSAFALAFSQFVIGPLMDVLAESALYHRAPQQNIKDCPELGVKLQIFMVNFFSSLPEENRGSVLLQIIQRLGSRQWCAVPLLFLSQALSCLPPCPLLGSDGLNAFREVMRCTMITHQVLLRGASQCFLLHAALCLTDVSAVSLDEIFGFLAHFRADESLCRGTALWKELCNWLQTNEGRFLLTDGDLGSSELRSKVASIFSYVQQRLNTFLAVPANSDQKGSLPDPAEAELVARAVLLTADLQKTRDEEPGLELLLQPLLDVLRRLSTNVYLVLHKTDKSLQLMLRLLQLHRRRSDTEQENEDVVAVALKTHMLSVVDSVQEFLLRRLSGELKELCDVERSELYLSVLRELVLTYSTVSWYGLNLQQNYIPKLTTHCLRILNEPSEQNPSVPGQVQRAVSMGTLALLCDMADQGVLKSQSEAMRSLHSLTDYFYPSSSSSSSSQHLNQTLLKPTTVTLGHPEDGLLLKDWGRIVAQFIGDQWTCLSFLQKCTGTVRAPEAPEVPEVLRAAVDALALLPGHLVLPVLDFMASVLPQVVQCEESLCVEVICASWKVVQALSTNPHDFWSTLLGFVRLAFDHGLLQLTEEQNPSITACIQQILSELMELAQVRSGVFNVLIQHCCETWLPAEGVQSDAVFSTALLHLDILTEACVYGPVFRRDQRLVQEVQSYVEQLGDSCAANTAVSSDNRDDQFPRVCALAFLCRLNPSNRLHQRLMEELVLRLLRKDAEISKSKVRYYSNSIQHRVKNRVWQTLLLLLHKLRPEFVSECVLSHVCEAGFCSNQASVKYLIEWNLILILHLNPSHIQNLWNCFSLEHEKTKTSICTFLSVLVHLNVLFPKLQEKEVQWRRAVEVSLQWCFSHNFSVRLYALLALKRVWELEDAHVLMEESLGGLTTVVQACLQQAEAMQNTGNAMKNWSRIQEHFFFSAFHPIRDYSVETIFQTFPSLSELADDEWIPPWKFESFVVFPMCAALPLKNSVRDLCELQPGDWIQQDKGVLDQDERWAEVQKKITPWKLSVQEQEPELMAQQRAARLGKLTSNLLVVASLIDKPTNLGGLCRTCEIFGAKALVLDSLRHSNDKQFQALSVSSELWLPMLEVKPAELSDYLQRKKREGYWVIGVEQTSNSQSLQDYTFPERSLLLLGNEREGIPANLLQLVDVCVEIPQHGVTRSLNVHVSAALLVWEYTRQHLGQNPAV
ncbi:probable methyltransferase TARBP1 isoform X2 [Pimephales promelas]|uniref:probable methyltransferase TARBP1 isoform X2 n=1 Tax=Pimephales promelas TaxID=90988 RepID=UPI001955F15F|nr:probable methyltransferase TARBP1 isoform X2 [Pimephales promelas]KAG1930327.1 tRNA/rRNA methyltransferase (SpoU) family protein [Pimephales promelas]